MKRTAGRLSRNTLWALIADALQLGIGSAAFFLLGDHIGPDQFGVYGAIIALATFAIPFASVGARALLMIDLSAGTPFPQLWSRSLSTVFVGGVVATILAAAVVRPWLFDEMGLLSFSALFLSQVCFFALSEFALVSTEAHRRLTIAIAIRLSSGLIRLCAVLLFIRFGDATVASFAWFGLVGWMVSGFLGLTIVSITFGASPRFTRPTSTLVRRGAPYALGAGSGGLLDSVDRPMLLELGSAQAAGVYNAGYRIAQLAMIPVNALVKSSDADFFDAGSKSKADALRLAVRMSSASAVYGIVVGIGLFIAAPLVPFLLGPEWDQTADIIRLLSALPLLKALQIFPANALTGSGDQRDRNYCYGGGVLVNVACNLALIPSYGVYGAIIATLVAETAMVFALWGFATRTKQSAA